MRCLLAVLIVRLMACGWTYGARAEDMSLEMALHEVLSSPRIQKSDSQAREGHWKKLEAYSGFLPTLAVGANHMLKQKYVLTDVAFGGNSVTVPAVVPDTTLSTTASLPLFDGFASTQQLRAARSNEAAADLEGEWSRFQTRREITLQFYKTLAAQDLKEVAEQNYRALNDHLRDTQLFKKSGVSTHYDVLRVEVQVSEASSELLNAADNVVLARQRLDEMLGHEEDRRNLRGQLPILEASLVDRLQFAATGRSDLRAVHERARAADLRDSAAAKYWLPRIGLFGTYQWYNNRNRHLYDANATRQAYQFGIGLSWNIFDGLASIARERQLAEQHFQSEKAAQLASIKAPHDFDFWKRRFIYFCSLHRARTNDVSKATESVRLAKEGRSAGIRTNTDLLDAETELYRARAGVVNAQVGAIDALINLELATGRQLYAFQ